MSGLILMRRNIHFVHVFFVCFFFLTKLILIVLDFVLVKSVYCNKILGNIFCSLNYIIVLSLGKKVLLK